ncbi:hypothetical protein ACIO13_08510 [Streptomyces sp. NPDC087425]|uniref:hypothetical protein n=1 Tax=Streptomyces sp. NPDC087425 TaxID=3365787 RepID=UPI003829A4A9
MAKRGNGLGGTPVEIPRTGRQNTWGVRTPLHFNPATGKRERYWIGRECKNKTEAERALRKWYTQALMNVLKWQKERQDAERERLGDLWVDHDLVFARDGFELYRGEAGGPQDLEKVSARWRTARNRLHLPDNVRLHDWRASKITNDLDNHENPVEVSANARHHSPGYTMARYGRRRAEGAKKLVASSASRTGLSSLV